MTWHHGFTADSNGAGSFDYTSFFATCQLYQAGFDITAYNERGDSVTTTVSTVPCN